MRCSRVAGAGTTLVTVSTGAEWPVPVVISRAGDKASRRDLQFFTATFRNRNMREAYGRAVNQFLAWC